jgi:hypothetical protein
MAKKANTSKTKNPREVKTQPEILKGWKEIAGYLGERVSVVQRWATEGMPVTKEGRLITTTPAQLDQWLASVSKKPVHIVTPETDLTAELKRGLAFTKKG